MKHKTNRNHKGDRLWLTEEQRRAIARKNIAKLKDQLGTEDWQQVFEETVSFGDNHG